MDDLTAVLDDLRPDLDDLGCGLDDLRSGASNYKVMGRWCGRKVAVPRFGEIGKAKTFPLLLLNPLIVAGTNVKVLQDIPEAVGIERFAFAVAAPRPTVEIISSYEIIEEEAANS